MAMKRKNLPAIIEVEGVRGFVDKNNVAWLNAEDVARGLGFTEKAASGNITIRWRTVRSYLESFGYQPIAGSCDDINGDSYIPENMFYRLAMKASNETAQAFQAKIADEILPSIRRGGFYSVYKKELNWLECARTNLNGARAMFEAERMNLDYARRLLNDAITEKKFSTAEKLRELAVLTTEDTLRNDLIRQAARILTD